MAEKLRVRVYKGVEDEEAWNAGEVDVLLVHPASCAYGLNLQAGGRHVVWYGLNWSFELNDQGNCRLYRQGSPYEKVFVHYLIVQGCEDEDVMATIRDGQTPMRLSCAKGQNTQGKGECNMSKSNLTVILNGEQVFCDELIRESARLAIQHEADKLTIEALRQQCRP